MRTQTSNINIFNQRSRQIRDQVLIILTHWGLLPRFNRWRLTQDPVTGMVVLFGNLNDRYIATHTSIPFRDYFDLRPLHDLANELGVHVVACTGDELRYAFVLDSGRFGTLPTHVDYPFIDNGKVWVRVVYADRAQPSSGLPADTPMVDDQTLVLQGVRAFIRVFDDTKRRNEAALFPALDAPDIVIIEEDEFKKSVAEHEATRGRLKRIRNFFGGKDQKNTS